MNSFNNYRASQRDDYVAKETGFCKPKSHTGLICRTSEIEPEIAAECGVGIDAVNKWVSKGKIPQEHWDKLVLLKSLILIPQKQSSSRVSEQQNTLNCNYRSEEAVPSSQKILSQFTDEELLSELKRRLNK